MDVQVLIVNWQFKDFSFKKLKKINEFVVKLKKNCNKF